MPKKPERQRALRGSIEARLLLRLPDDLDKAARKAAKRQGVSVTEWWRRAGLRALRAPEGQQGEDT
jgi:hypothetical protein